MASPLAQSMTQNLKVMSKRNAAAAAKTF